MFPIASESHVKPPATDTVAYGGYLADAGGCHECHGSTLANGAVGPNITMGGKLAGWSETDFVRAIREGKRPDGSSISEKMPWKDFRNFTAYDVLCQTLDDLALRADRAPRVAGE